MDVKQVGLTTLADWLRHEKITIFHAGASVFRGFVQQLTGAETFPDLRMIRVGSGQLFDKDVELYKRCFPKTLFFHTFTCTEIHIYRALFLNKDSEVPHGALPVGYAVEDIEVLILDESGTPLETNEVGEITIRSAYLFRGYWNNSALTDSVFVTDPYDGSRKIFRTGDLGRLRPDGCLEFLGRKDFRLKIRGHRIHAEEVELALLQLPEISQAVVVANKDAYGDDRLVAYVAPADKEFPTVSHLRNSLKQRLPDYMLPHKFMILESLPLTTAGKIDRRALPKPNLDRPELGVRYSAPKTTVESLLAKLWSEALGINRVGIYDSFFDLGGDSIIASRIVSVIARIFPWKLTMAEFYEACTVAATARRLIEKAPTREGAERVAALYLQVQAMAPVEVERLLADERSKRQTDDEATASRKD